jgi:hypothetical protein
MGRIMTESHFAYLGDPHGVEFLNSYRMAFEAFNPDRVRSHFAFPLHLTSDADEVSIVCVPTREAWRTQVERLLGVYRTLGVASAQPLDTRISPVSRRLLSTHVRWHLRTAAGAAIYEFDVHYLLVKIDGDFRIAAIAHNETPRLRASLSRPTLSFRPNG